MTEPGHHADARGVGVIGLGRMGGAMAGRILKAGHRVKGFDVRAEAVTNFVARGGQSVNSPALAAEGAEVLLVMVYDATQVDRVLFGGDDGDTSSPGIAAAITHLAPGCIVWLGSTVSPAYARQLAARLATHDVALIDGPVSGGATGADDGNLVAICGAEAHLLASAAFAMDACTQHVYRAGAPGMGSTIKMINQLLVTAHSALTSEAMALAVRSGVDPALLIEVISQSAGTSRIFEKRAPRIAAGDHAVHVSIETLRKDLQIVIATARELGLTPAIAQSVQALLATATDAGHGADSDTTLIDDYLNTRSARIKPGT